MDTKERKKLGIVHNPAITINGAIYRGDLNGPDIFKAICSTFKPKKRPKYCDAKFDIATVLGHEIDLLPKNWDPRTVKEIHIIFMILVIVAVNACLLYAYRRYQKKQMSSDVELHVQEHVQKYFKLQESERNLMT